MCNGRYYTVLNVHDFMHIFNCMGYLNKTPEFFCNFVYGMLVDNPRSLMGTI